MRGNSVQGEEGHEFSLVDFRLSLRLGASSLKHHEYSQHEKASDLGTSLNKR